MKKTAIASTLATLILGAASMSTAQAGSHSMGACLITKTDTNPFFVKMKEGAEQKAEELGIALKSYAGKVDGDSESQVAAIETCIADGAKGILIACLSLVFLWLIAALSMAQPEYLSLQMLNVGIHNARQASKLTHHIASQEGVFEVEVREDDGIAYLKIDSKITSLVAIATSIEAWQAQQ